MRRYQLLCLLWKSLVIWYALYSHQKMARTVSPLTKTAIVTLIWLDLKTLQQQTLYRQRLETWQMQNVSVLTSVSKRHRIRVFKPHNWCLFFLTLYFFLCMYLCNLFSFFGLMFPKMFVSAGERSDRAISSCHTTCFGVKAVFGWSYPGSIILRWIKLLLPGEPYSFTLSKTLLSFGFQVVSLCICNADPGSWCLSNLISTNQCTSHLLINPCSKHVFRYLFTNRWLYDYCRSYWLHVFFSMSIIWGALSTKYLVLLFAYSVTQVSIFVQVSLLHSCSYY